MAKTHTHYRVDKKTGKTELAKRQCPSCEKGTLMAEHYDRFACGRCGYTEFKRKGSG